MKAKIRIEGKRIFLKSLGEENATDDYCGWLNDREVNVYLETRKTTVEELKEYIREKNESENALFLGMFLKENSRHIGNIKLEPIDFEKKTAVLGILLGDKSCWGQGIGTEAVKLLLRHAFEELGLQEVSLGVLSENKPAIRVYEKSGMRIDKVKKKSKRHGSRYFDQVLMSVRKTDKPHWREIP